MNGATWAWPCRLPPSLRLGTVAPTSTPTLLHWASPRTQEGIPKPGAEGGFEVMFLGSLPVDIAPDDQEVRRPPEHEPSGNPRLGNADR
jgi:hypothetical protein